MNVFEVLKKDHRETRAIFERIEALSAGARKTREELFRRLKDELTRHAEAEEGAFYPRFRDAAPTHDLVAEGRGEHERVKKMLARIETIPVDSDDWMQAILDLKESVEHHVREEEDELFPKIRKMIAQEQVERLGEEVEDAKRR